MRLRMDLNFYLTSTRSEAASHHTFRTLDGVSFTEGSIGGDIEKVNLTSFRRFTEKRPAHLGPLQRSTKRTGGTRRIKRHGHRAGEYSRRIIRCS